MQGIFTKYHGPTSTKGSRISARTSSGTRIYRGYDHVLSSGENHSAAAKALRDKMGWTGEMVGAGLPNQTGYAFAFTHSATSVPA